MSKRIIKQAAVTALLRGVLGAALALSGVAGYAANWTITDLGTLGGDTSEAWGINNAGQVVGQSLTINNAATHAFVTGVKGGAMTDLGTLGGDTSIAFAISNSGRVVGQSSNGVATHAFVSEVHGGALIDLGTLGGGDSFAYDINNAGRVVGASNLTNNHNITHAFLSGLHGGLIDLGTLGGTSSQALAINDAGEIAGRSETTINSATNNSAIHVFTTDTHGGPLTDLGTLGGTLGYPNDINNRGQVVGFSSTENDAAVHAFIGEADGGTLMDLGTLEGNTYSEAFSINNAGDVVGYTETTAFFYSVETGMEDLNTFLPSDSGWVLQVARSINDSDQITGYGQIHGHMHAFLLSPHHVSEASSLALALAALGALIWLSQLRRARLQGARP